MYRLISEDLTQLGPLGGTMVTTINWTEYFDTVAMAEAFAEADYMEQVKARAECPEEIVWTIEKDHIDSQDLGFVLYSITKLRVRGVGARTYRLRGVGKT